MAIIGYIRVSSSKQTCEHQRYEITQFAKQNNIIVNKWVTEAISSRKALNKRQLGQLLNELQSNDILIAAEISRLGRSLLEVMHILEYCLNKNCQVWTIKENYRLGNDIQFIGKRAGNRQTIGATFFGAIKKTETVQQYQKSKKIVGHGVDQVSDCQNNAG